MANGKLKGKQIEDKTLDLEKLSGLGSVDFVTSSVIKSKGSVSIEDGSFNVTGGIADFNHVDTSINGGTFSLNRTTVNGYNTTVDIYSGTVSTTGTYIDLKYGDIDITRGYINANGIHIDKDGNMDMVTGDFDMSGGGDFNMDGGGSIGMDGGGSIGMDGGGSIGMNGGGSIDMTGGNININSGGGINISGIGKIKIASTAVDPNDVVTMKDLTSVGGKLTISDYNTGASFSNIENIIFRGQNVLVPGPSGTTATGVNVQSGGPNVVTVWIPAATYADYFNTDSKVITPEATTLRNVADPMGNEYDVGDWNGKPLTGRTVLNEPSGGKISYTCTDFGVYDLNTTLDFTIYDASGGLAKSISMTVGTNSNTSDGLTIDVTSFSADEDRYKATVTFTADLEHATFPSSANGRFSVELVHNNSTDGTYTFTQNDIFYDNDGANTSATIGTLDIEEKTPNLVWRSGIAYYAANSSFTFSVNGIDYINDRSYPQGSGNNFASSSLANQLRLTPMNFNMGQSYGHTTDFTNWANYWDVTGMEWVFEESINSSSTFIPNLTTANNLNTAIVTTIDVEIYDWKKEAGKNSDPYKALIDTYPNSNSNTTDPVGDESKRLDMSNLTYTSSSWDSTATLPADALQVAFDKIIFPRENYSLYNPEINGTNGFDYSSSTGATLNLDVYDNITTGNIASTSKSFVGYRWYASHFLIPAVKNGGTITFTSNIVEQDLEIKKGNNTLNGDDGVAILVGHDSANQGAGVTPDKYIYITGDKPGRTAALSDTMDGAPKKLTYTWSGVGSYARLWVLIGIKSSKSDKWVSEINITGS